MDRFYTEIRDSNFEMFNKVMIFTRDMRRQFSYSGIVFTLREDVERFSQCISYVMQSSLYRSWAVDYEIYKNSIGYLCIRFRNYSSPCYKATLSEIMSSVIPVHKRGRLNLI